MIDITPLAVPHTMNRLRAVLPPPPASVLEVGCGRGALAAELATAGYDVTGVEPDEDSASAARDRGVRVVQSPVAEVPDDLRCDVLMFTRSLHHVDDLDAAVRHALGLVAPGGLVVLEEFDRERMNLAATGFFYDLRGLLIATGVLKPPEHVDPVDPDADPLARWEQANGAAAEEPLHTGRQMCVALQSAGGHDLELYDIETLWRMVAQPGSLWQGGEDTARAAAGWCRQIECRRIAEGTLPAVGMFVTARVPR